MRNLAIQNNYKKLIRYLRMTLIVEMTNANSRFSSQASRPRTQAGSPRRRGDKIQDSGCRHKKPSGVLYLASCILVIVLGFASNTHCPVRLSAGDFLLYFVSKIPESLSRDDKVFSKTSSFPSVGLT